MDFLSALDVNYRRLTQVSTGSPDVPVPTCPDWTMRDLVTHVALVYLHKVAAMRLNGEPEWPPPGEPSLPAAYRELLDEFARRDPADKTRTWFGPDQTVGFWIRRMAHETVIHRIDAELAAGVPSVEVPPELALDGIDEALVAFLSWPSREWAEYYTEALSKGDGTVKVMAADRRWLISWDSSGVRVAPSTVDETADAQVSGAPDAVLRWLWGRAEAGVAISGDQGKLAQLRELLLPAMQ